MWVEVCIGDKHFYFGFYIFLCYSTVQAYTQYFPGVCEKEKGILPGLLLIMFLATFWIEWGLCMHWWLFPTTIHWHRLWCVDYSFKPRDPAPMPQTLPFQSTLPCGAHLWGIIENEQTISCPLFIIVDLVSCIPTSPACTHRITIQSDTGGEWVYNDNTMNHRGTGSRVPPQMVYARAQQ